MRNVVSIEPRDKSRTEFPRIAMDRYAFYRRLTRSSYLIQRATIDGFVNVLIRGIAKLLYQTAYVRPDIWYSYASRNRQGTRNLLVHHLPNVHLSPALRHNRLASFALFGPEQDPGNFPNSLPARIVAVSAEMSRRANAILDYANNGFSFGNPRISNVLLRLAFQAFPKVIGSQAPPRYRGAKMTVDKRQNLGKMRAI